MSVTGGLLVLFHFFTAAGQTDLVRSEQMTYPGYLGAGYVRPMRSKLFIAFGFAFLIVAIVTGLHPASQAVMFGTFLLVASRALHRHRL